MERGNMNKQEFEALRCEDQRLAKEAYLDGFKAAMATVESYRLRTGSEVVDRVSDSTVKQITSVLEANLNRMK